MDADLVKVLTGISCSCACTCPWFLLSPVLPDILLFSFFKSFSLKTLSSWLLASEMLSSVAGESKLLRLLFLGTKTSLLLSVNSDLLNSSLLNWNFSRRYSSWSSLLMYVVMNKNVDLVRRFRIYLHSSRARFSCMIIACFLLISSCRILICNCCLMVVRNRFRSVTRILLAVSFCRSPERESEKSSHRFTWKSDLLGDSLPASFLRPAHFSLCCLM